MKLFCIALAGMVSGCAVGSSPTNGTEDAGPPPNHDSGTDAAPKKQPPDSGTPLQDAGTDADTDVSVPLTDSTCAAESTKSTCEQCCLKVHPTGYTTYHQALQTCTCTTPGTCSTECATESCAGKATTSGDACDTCITSSLTSGTGACYTPVDSACQGDPDCVTLFQTCIPPCETK